MDKNGLLREIHALYEECPGNTVSEAQALYPEVMGEKLFEAPILGIGSAEDALFTEYKKPEVVGPWFLTPTEWMESARTVVSLFFSVYPGCEEKQLDIHGWPVTAVAAWPD